MTNSETTNSVSDTSNAIPVLQIDAGKVTGNVSPTLYGLMTEEINFSYEGGLYGELIRNRTFKANAKNPVDWNVVGDGIISLDTNQPLNAALNVSLKLDTSKASENSPVGIANGGYWGIAVRPNTTYRASFYAKGKKFSGSLTVSLESAAGKNIFASATIPKISGKWKKYEMTLTTGNVETSKDNRLVISTTKPGNFFSRHGTVWFDQVSLFPPTYNNRPNGTRPDIMQLLADMHPAFLRFPGGNYLEGNTIPDRFNWKETIGDISQRSGHESPWGYWSTDGFGLLEFLEWCEDLHMQPVLAIYAGYSMHQKHVAPGTNLDPYVQDALDEIEYVTGDAGTKWGARRGQDGHPAPFTLNYVEIGNEDQFDPSHSYNGRFAQFYDAIKAKYPNLQIIATTPVTNHIPDLIDEHYYRSAADFEQEASVHFDKYDRKGPKIFVGEWAAYEDIQPWNKESAHLPPTPGFKAALGDAAWMTALERNSDLIVMQCYAPLLVNVNPGGRQWRPNLIGYDALNSFGSPSYYAQKMFSTHHGDEILATDSQNIPTRARHNRNGVEPSAPPAPQIQELFFDATRDSQSGTIFLKVVNSLDTPQPVHVEISGASAVEAEGEAVVLKANSLDDTNSIDDPKKIIPETEKVSGLGTDFTREFPPFSITILELQAK